MIIETQTEVGNAVTYTRAESDARYINYDGDIVAGNLQISGEVDAGSLIVDTDVLVVDATNNRVGIGEASPDYRLEVKGTATTNTDIVGFSNSNGTVKHIFGLENVGAGRYSIRDASNNTAVFFSAHDADNSYVNAGSFLVGTTNADVGGSVTGIALKNTGAILSSTDGTGLGAQPLYADRRGTNNEGDILMLALGGFYKSSIGVFGTNSGSNNGGITFNTIANNVTKTERMRITSAGNIGIGTASPSAFLDVVSNSASGYVAEFRESNASNFGTILIDSPTDGESRPSYMDYATGGTVKWSTGLAYLDTARSFHIGTGSGLSNSKVTIGTSGNVGIGETSPDARFHIKNSLASTGVGTSSAAIVVIQNERVNTGSSSSVLRFDTNEITGTNQYSRAAIGAEYDDASNVNGRLMFSTADTSGNLQERLRIDSSGNVGIGTNNPQHALHIKGSLPYIALEDTDNGATHYSTITGNSDGNIYYDANFNNVGGVNGGHIFRNNGAGVSPMRIHSDGYVTMPNQPAFHAGVSTNTSSLTSGSVVVFNTVYENRGNHYNTSTGIFTAPVTGFYSFTTRLLHQGVSNGFSVDSYMSKNNSGSSGNAFLMQRYKYQADYTGYGGYLSEGGSAMVYLAAGDTFRVKYGGGQNSVIHGNPSWSYFCGHLVS